MLKSLATVSGLTLLSRVFGFVRQILVAGVIGAGGNPVADAFWAAFRLPNMFRRLFAEGAFHAAFIPLFQARAVEDREAARIFAADVMAGLVLILTVLTIIVELAAPAFVYLLAGGFSKDPEKFALTVLYTRIMFPYLFCMSLVGLFSGILNSFKRFAAAAAAPLLLNVFLIGGILLYARGDTEEAGMAAAWGVFFGGIAQLGLLWWGIRRQHFGLALRMPRFSPGVQRLLALGAPGFISAGALQINLIVGTNIASQQPGAVSWLMNADALYQLPLAVIGIAMGSILLPDLSHRVKSGDEAGAVSTLNRAIETAALLCFPAAAAFMIMAAPICDALYRGLAGDALGLFGVAGSAFTADDVARTGGALALFGIGLPAFVWQKVFLPAFYAREDTRTPMIFALVAIALNTGLALALFPRLGFLSIPIATSLAAWAQVMLLAINLHRRALFQPTLALFTGLARILIISTVLAVGLIIILPYQDEMTSLLFDRQWISVIIIAAAGAILYGLLAVLTGALRLFRP
ncbi:MAG: murein biosynthesis integral membrane protein MurJ [Pseudomonadota bacterium]